MERRLRIFIGYDSREVVAFHTLVQSIIEHTTVPFDIIPINLKNLDVYTRIDKGSTEFAFSRFLVPYLSNYEGTSLFMDCDMLVMKDLKELTCLDRTKAIHVVKHDYEPKTGTKFLGEVQTSYPRKNWSSFVVWHCEHPENRKLTPDKVNTASGSWLHQFKFLSDSSIGELDVGWNWLVGEYDKPNCEIKNIHWTLGGPYFNKYRYTEFYKEWFSTLKKVLYVEDKE